MQDSFCCYCGIEYNFLGFDTPTEKAYQINNGLDDTLQDMWRIQRAVSNWRQHRRRIQRQRRKIFWLLPIMIGSAVSVWLNTQYHGIDDTPTTEEEYQINNWIETASETDSIQWRCQLFVWLAVCGWTLNLNIDRGIRDTTTTATTTTKTYHINNPMVLYTRREAFNG